MITGFFIFLAGAVIGRWFEVIWNKSLAYGTKAMLFLSGGDKK